MGLLDKLAELNDRLVAIRNPRKALSNRQFREAVSIFSYRAATRSRISGIKLGLGGSGDDHAKDSDLWTLREYSRELDRNNVIASSILDRATEAVIGSGLDLQIQSGDRAWDQQAEEMFRSWWDTEADIRGLLSGWQMEQLAFRASRVDGDILFLKTDSGQLQAIEADKIATPPSMRSRLDVINGVEVNSVGRPIAFHVSEIPVRTPGSSPDSAFRRILVKDVIFLLNTKRFSQTRGVPIFATNMGLFDDLDAFIEACLVGAKVSISHVMFIQKEGGLGELDGVRSTQDDQGDTRQEQTVSPGMILYGKPGEKAAVVGSTQPMVQFSPFVTQLLRFTGLNFGLPLEMVSLDFSNTNYSSARAALLVAHKSFLTQHKYMVKRFMEPVVRWKLDAWIAAGQLPAPKAGYRVTATPPRFPSVDPLKESAADIQKVQHGFSTNREVCAGLGSDWADVFAERAREIEEAIRLASEISGRAGVKVDWRDITGGAENFDAALYQDEPLPGKPVPVGASAGGIDAQN